MAARPTYAPGGGLKGRLTRSKNRVSVSAGAPAVQWVVDDATGMDTLAALLRKHPLPPESPKAPQLDAWIELLALRRHIRVSAPRGAIGRDPDLARLAAEIRTGKQYAGPWD